MRLPLVSAAEVSSPHRLPLADSARQVDRQARPIYAVWELTLRCDLACRHCGSRAGHARPNELTTEEALELVDQLASLGIKEVTLIGGEAYLHEGWERVCQAIVRAGMLLSMVTGGRGMSSERARRVREAGVSFVGISFDALEPLHDELRGVKGSFRAAFEAIQHLRAEGIWVTANTQITRPALRQIEPLLDQLTSHGVQSWQVSMTVPMGRAADRPDLVLQPYQVLEVLPMLARLHALLTARGVRLIPANDIGYFGPHEELLRGSMPGGHRPVCSAGKLGLGIEANGDIKGCPSLPSADYVGGSVRDHALREIWERSPPLQFTRERGVEDLWGFCRTCYYAEDCLGGCSWTAHVLFGRRGNNPFCHHRALELLQQGKRERITQVRSAGGQPFDHGLFSCEVEDWPAGELARARRLVESGEGWLD